MSAADASTRFDALVILRREWRRCSAACASGLAAGLLYFLLAPRWYTATLSAIPTQPQRGAAALPAQISATAFAGLDLLLESGTDVDRIEAVFRSDSVTDAVIEKFDLKSRYNEKYQVPARRELWEHCQTRVEKKARVFSLECEDQDPTVAQAMTGFFGETANLAFRRVGTSSASEEVKFLEKRVEEARGQAEAASRHLRDFEERYKVVDLEAQSRAVVSAMAALKSDEISKELQLAYLAGFASRDEGSAKQLRRQIDILASKLRNLEESPARADPPGESPAPAPSAGDKANIFPRALAVPQLRFELEELFRDQKLEQAMYLMLMQRLETARINEARDTSTFQVLDRPRLPDHKSRPRGVVALALGLALGLLAGLSWVLGRPLLEELRIRWA